MEKEKVWFYDYENKCDCSEDDKCGCSYDNNMARNYDYEIVHFSLVDEAHKSDVYDIFVRTNVPLPMPKDGYNPNVGVFVQYKGEGFYSAFD